MFTFDKWSLKRTVEPASEPITPADLKDHLRISVDDQDRWALRAITAARQFVETVQWRTLMTSTWRLSTDRFPSWELKIPMPPLQSISSITYLDVTGATQTLSSSLYIVSSDSEPGRVTPAYSQIWPVTRPQLEAVKVTYVAGYSSAAAIPQTTLLPLMAIAADCYETREFSTEAIMKNSPQYISMLESDRVLDFSGPMGSSNGIPSAVSAWGGNGGWR